MPRWTLGTGYFFGVTVVGAVLAAWVLRAPGLGAHLIHPLFAGLALLSIVAELVAVPLPRGGRLTASFAFLFSTLLTMGFAPTVVALGLVAAVANLVVQRRHWSLATFNFAQYTLSYGAAWLVLTLGGYTVHAHVGFEHLPVLLAAVLAQLGTNVVLVNSYIALEKRIPLWQVLWEDDRWELVFTLVLSPLSLMMVALYMRWGLKGAAMLVLPLFVSAVLLIFFLKVQQSNRELALAHEELSLVHEIAQRIVSQIDLGQTLAMIAAELKRVIPHDEGMIFLLDDESQKLVRQRTGTGAAKSMEVKVGEGLIGRAGRATERHESLEGVLTEGEEALAGFQSALAVPISTDDRPMGAIALFSTETRAFTGRDERLLVVLASQAAVAIKNAQLYQTTQQLAITDGLTGVYNRRYFQRQLEAEFRRAPRFGHPVGLIMIDVDFFKQFNDSHGHLLGDQVLRSMAQILRDSVRETDVVARYGGEEFAVILPETNAEHALEVAERIRRNVGRHTFWGRGQTPVSVTVSIGVASRLASDLKSDELIELADMALYQAKHTGRDRICAAGAPGEASFTMAEPRASEEPPKRRAPARSRSLDVHAWKAYLHEGLKPLLDAFLAKLADQDLVIDDAETQRWRATVEAMVTNLADQLTQRAHTGALTIEAVAQHPLYHEIKAGISHLIQRGITLTQSESLILSLSTGLGKHVQQGPYSPQDRLYVLSEVERFTHTLQLAVSQVWHEFYQQTSHHLVAQHELEQRLGEARDLDDCLPEAVHLATAALKADLGWLAMPRGGSREDWRYQAVAGYVPPEGWTRLPRREGLVRAVLDAARPLMWSEPEAIDEAWSPVAELRSQLNLGSLLVLPLVHQEEPLGLLIFGSHTPNHFDPGLVRLGRSLAGKLGAAIARLRAEELKQDSYLEALVGLVEHLEAQDEYEHGHAERLVELSTAVAQQLGLAAGELAVLRHAAMLHDLGKVGLPEEVTQKPSRLTEEERAVVERHPEIGARLLGSVASLKEVVPIVRHHHEHFDGSGYPDGLVGEQIPLLARILATAEVFHGMTSPRAYREAIPVPEVLAMMRESGHHDPRVLDELARAVPSLPQG